MRTKRPLVAGLGTLLLLAGTPTISTAQVMVGLSGGVSASQLHGASTSGDFSSLYSPRVGAYVSVGLGERMSMRSGIYRVSRGTLLDGLHTRWTALSVPLQFDVRLASSGPLSYHGYTGLSLDFKGACSQESRFVERRRREFTENLCRSPVGNSSPQVGTLIGAGVELRGRDGVTAVGRLSYELGLDRLYDGPAGQDLRARGWAVELGLMWTISGEPRRRRVDTKRSHGRR